jgi:exosortase
MSSAPSVREPKTGRNTLQLTALVCLAGLVIALYFGVVRGLIQDWSEDANFSHGFVVPIFCGIMAWMKRRELAALPVRGSNLGLVPIFFAMILLTVGNFGAELFTARISLVFLIGGLIIFLPGWRHFRALSFSVLCLFLMIPIPAIIFNQITLPLQTFAAKLAASVLEAGGIPVLREGNVIQLASMPLEVAEACSGIRSLLSLGTLAIVYGYFLEHKNWKRVVLALASVPIAVAANALRIVGTGLAVQYWDPVKALGFFHEFSGWLVFLVAFAMLLLVQKLLHTRQPKEAAK